MTVGLTCRNQNLQYNFFKIMLLRIFKKYKIRASALVSDASCEKLVFYFSQEFNIPELEIIQTELAPIENADVIISFGREKIQTQNKIKTFYIKCV